MASPLSGFSVNPGSAVSLPGSKRFDLKTANVADPVKAVEKKDIFPTDALGVNGKAPSVAPGAQSADFYRFGKPTVGSERGSALYDVQPRTLDENDDDVNTASIRIFGQGPKDQAPKDFIPAYTKFFLDGVDEGHAERSQVIETFGQFYVFFFGERPPVYTFRGQLVNAKNANWVNDFSFMYENYLRGTRCVERNAKAILTYGGRQVEGFITNFSTSTNATLEGAVPLHFQVIVTERKYLGFSDDLSFSDSTLSRGDLAQDENFQKLLDQIAGKTGKDSSVPKVSELLNSCKGAMDGVQMPAGLHIG